MRFFLNGLLAIALLLAVELKVRGTTMTSEDLTAASLLQEGDTAFQSRDYERALIIYQKAVTSAKEEFNRPVEVEGLSQVARMMLLTNRVESGKVYLEEARQRANQSDSMGWSRYLGVRGRFEWKEGSLKAARATFEEMYDYCSTSQLWARAVDAAHMVAIVSEQPEEQIAWGKKGIGIAEARETMQWLGPLWNNLAGSYFETKEYDSALECYLKARDYHWRFSDERAKLVADYHIGMTYRVLREYEEARKWLRPVLAWAERLEDHDMIGQSCEDLGEAEIGLGNRPNGLALVKRARDEYKIAGYEQNAPDIWNNINSRIIALEKK